MSPVEATNFNCGANTEESRKVFGKSKFKENLRFFVFEIDILVFETEFSDFGLRTKFWIFGLRTIFGFWP